MRTAFCLVAASAVFGLAATPATALLNISSRATKNIACSAGVCTATSKVAFLNVTDLENLLASSDVTVNTAAGSDAIVIAAPFAWSSAHGLTLNAGLDVRVGAAVAAQAAGGLSINYNGGHKSGELLFLPGGRIDFWDTTSPLAVNGTTFVLVGDLATLASDVEANPGTAYAFVKDYDAGPDGPYQNGVTNAGFAGTLEGLGHTISNLSIQGGKAAPVGMFEQTGEFGVATFRDLILANVNVTAERGGWAGALLGNGQANVFGVSSSGTVTCGDAASCGGLIGSAGYESTVTNSASSASVSAGADSVAGGLIGFSEGAIFYSQASGNVFALRHSDIGGLAGNGQSVFESFATGNVSSSDAVRAGGLFGSVGPSSYLLDCYATGTVQGGAEGHFGGLIGNDNEGTVNNCYSTGSVAAHAPMNTRIGGFVGKYRNGGMNGADYWDVDTSGQSASCARNCSTAFTGLSDTALKSSLPEGFDDRIWAQSAAINNGYPYLIANPPQ